MAKTTGPDAASTAAAMIEDARKGIFKSVYLLMGEEPYYIDKVADAILDCAIPEEARDFNQLVCYGADVTADDIITSARRYPMFAERQLVMVKEAQMMKDYEALSVYCEHPLESTILVICLRGAKADKRKALYKTVQKSGGLLESAPVPDYKMVSWINAYYRSLGLDIVPDAAALLAEFAGTDLGKIALETEKMLKNLPEGTARVTVENIEDNIGISRQMSMFELTKALSLRDAAASMRIADNVASVKNFSLVPVVSVLYAHFYKLLRNALISQSQPGLPSVQRAALLGVAPFFMKDYDAALSLWPVRSCMQVISLLKDYDYQAKGGDGGDIGQAELCREMVLKILTR